MADTKISALAAIDAVAAGDKVAVADASDLTLSKSATMTQINTYLQTLGLASAQITALGAAAAIAAAHTFPVSQSGTALEATALQLRDYCSPRGYLWGLTMSNAADAANDITVAAGEAKDENGTVIMVLDSAITKQIDASWAVGTAAGGMNTGAVADSTWYEVHLIKRVDTGVVDVMFTTTANRATLPTSYTLQRRIGWVRRGVSTNLAFTQIDDYFTLTTTVNDASFTATATAAPITMTAPPSSIVRFRGCVESSTAVNTTNATVFSEIVEGDKTPTETTGLASIGANDIAGASAGHYEMRVSSTSTIEHDSDGTTYTVDIGTFGWIDARGQLSGT